MVFIPAEEADLRIGLEYMTSHNISFLAIGGGHGTSIQLGELHGAVAINLENFNYALMNPDGTLKVGGGAEFGDIYSVVHEAGRELTLGNCPCVGVTGAVLGGGHGRLQGKHGLSADAVTKARIVLWDGSVVEASATENADLFWGLRGAGHNFGIVTELTFNTWPQENDGMHYNAAMEFTTGSLEGILATVNDIIPDQDPALAIEMFFYTNPQTFTPFLTLNVVYAGPREIGEKYAARFATSAPNSTDYPITRVSINETLIAWDELPHVVANGLIDLACIDGSAKNVYSSSTAQFDIPHTRQLFDAYVAFVEENPLAVLSLVFYEVFGQQGVLAQRPEDTSVGNRESANVLILIQAIYTDPSVAEAGDAWAREWRDQLFEPEHSGYDRPAVYVNYAHGDEAREAIYGYEPWRLERLRRLKQRYDPRGYFDSYHPVT
ncbi:hypothetical protein DL766_003266 [Monosporascus sp. MC13-8B]|uniref:FAD-binding PCMH-type domain-containing protein n=1 Tax=Monosporascus cannonballus TaxID=155416 RepID=A0ABY0HFN2_9PEZI|nr:hypothetical protein DL762_003229 [Monosporascus cannonballus]RYP00818.1 hypothetical protein DL763_000543 [Monosporascus cannonballus]RYP33825.1 hypothetical protein DL766_003266 [Monosporascus sp. MC13-8B]